MMNTYETAFNAENMSTPDMIADVIYVAATDGKSTIRYRAGDDAHQLLSARDQMHDDDFLGMMKQNLNLVNS